MAIEKYIMINGCRVYYDNKVWEQGKLKNVITDLYITGKMGMIRTFFSDDIKRNTIKIVNVKIK
jgi:hypothetical protein